MQNLLEVPGLVTPRESLWSPRAGDGCVLWLPGQDDAYSATIRDRSGNGNHGTIYGATWVRNDKGLWVLSFGALNDQITFVDAASLNFGTGAFALEIWMYPNTITGVHMIFAKRVGGAFWNLYQNAAILVLEIRDGASISDFSSVANSLVATVWQHILVYRTGGTGAIFVNNIDKTSGTPAGTNINTDNTAQLTIGTSDVGYPADALLGFERLYKGSVPPNHYQQERYLLGV